MSKPIYTSVFFVVLLSLLGCSSSGGDSTIVLNDSEGIKKLNNVLKDQFDLKKEIKSINITNKTNPSNEVEQIAILFEENNQDAIWFYDTQLAKLFKPEPTGNSLSKSKMLPLSAFHTEEILTFFNSAVILIQKETNEFENYQLNRYDMSIDEKSGKIVHVFDVIADKKGNGTSVYGKRINRNENAFNFRFSSDEKGELNCTSGLNIF